MLLRYYHRRYVGFRLTVSPFSLPSLSPFLHAFAFFLFFLLNFISDSLLGTLGDY